MCSDRLKVGEAPACVQACPHEAIKIRLVDRAEAVAMAEANIFLPTAPDASYTLPTTRYITDRPLQGAVRAGDHFRNEPEHAHWPLVIMLVLTQASAGGYAVEFLARTIGHQVPATLSMMSLILGLVGIHAALLHLGRPLYAYRAFIGIRHSWLSREVVAFGLFANMALMHAATCWFRPDWTGLTSALVVASGALAVVCSVMVYHVVQRPFWRFSISAPKFFGTAAVLGLAGAMAATGGARSFALGLVVATALKLAVEASTLMHLRDPRFTLLRRTAKLLTGRLSQVTALRLGLGLAGGVVLPLALAAFGGSTAVAWIAFVVVFAGEVAERYLFFTAVVRPKMPGGLSA